MKVRLMTSDSVDVLAFGANSADVLKLTVKVEQAYLIKEQCVRESVMISDPAVRCILSHEVLSEQGGKEGHGQILKKTYRG